jgi:putative endonuclease
VVRSTTQRDKQLSGQAAEQSAYTFLCREGLRLVCRNFRCRRGEIDLIMLDGQTLVFAEVRHRSSGSFVRAVLTVDRRKQRKLASAAAMFLAKHRNFGQHTSRFDVVGIDRDANDGIAIEWIKDAFRPGS